MYDKFQETGSFADVQKSDRPKIVAQEKLNALQATYALSHNKSMQCLPIQFKFSRTTQHSQVLKCAHAKLVPLRNCSLKTIVNVKLTVSHL